MRALGIGTLKLLERAGIRVSADGDRLRLEGPPEAIEEVRDILPEYREAILAALGSDPLEPKPGTVAEIDGRRWVYRPDAQGRMGWECVSLRELEAWWKRARFEGLPQLPERFFEGATKNRPPESP